MKNAIIFEYLLVVHHLGFSEAKLQKAELANCLVFDSRRVFTNVRSPPTFMQVTRLRYAQESANNDPGLHDVERAFYAATSDGLFQINNQVVKRHSFLTQKTVNDVDLVNTTLSRVWNRNEGFSSFDKQMVRVFIGKDVRVFYDHFRKANAEKFSRLARTWHMFYFTSKHTSMVNVAKFLAYIWKQFGILNTAAQIPCSSKYRGIVAVYKPFIVNSRQKYGQVLMFSVAKVRKHQHFIGQAIPSKLNGYPLKVSIFSRYPTAIKHLPLALQDYKIYKNIPGTSTFYGLDGVLLSELSWALNFSIKIIMDLENQYYGYVTSNGTIMGSLGQTARKAIDLQANTRYFVNNGISSVEYTSFFIFDYLCILVSKSETVPKWLEIVYVFLTKANVVAIAVWMACCYFNVITRTSVVVSKQKAVMEMYCTAIGHPQKALIAFHPSMSRRIFITTCLIFSMISIPLLTAKLVKTFTSVNWWPDINSLQELLQSGLYIKSSLNPFVSQFNEIYQKLSHRIDTNWLNTTAIELVAQSKQWAAIERLRDAKLLIASRYTDGNGIPLLHIIPEYVANHYMGYIVPTGSPYLLLINKVVTRFNEAGLLDKWYKDLEDGFIADARAQRDEDLVEDSARKAFNLVDIQSVFYVLCCGYLLSLVAFLGEIFLTRKQ